MKPTAFGRREPPLITPLGAVEALSDTGAISTASFKTNWTTTGAATGTLADGDYDGQVKVIQMVADLGDAVLTPDNLWGGTTITFADVGDTVWLVWVREHGAWFVIDAFNMVDGATAPVVA